MNKKVILMTAMFAGFGLVSDGNALFGFDQLWQYEHQDKMTKVKQVVNPTEESTEEESTKEESTKEGSTKEESNQERKLSADDMKVIEENSYKPVFDSDEHKDKRDVFSRAQENPDVDALSDILAVLVKKYAVYDEFKQDVETFLKQIDEAQQYEDCQKLHCKIRTSLQGKDNKDTKLIQKLFNELENGFVNENKFYFCSKVSDSIKKLSRIMSAYFDEKNKQNKDSETN